METGDWATWAGVVVALVAGFAGLGISLSTRSQTKKQADQMVHQTDLMRESNALAQEAHQLATSLAAPNVEWTLRHHGGDTFLVVNTGTGIAHDVRVDHEGLVPSFGDPFRETLAPGEGLDFMASVSFTTTSNDVIVIWSPTRNGPQSSWRHPLPAK